MSEKKKAQVLDDLHAHCLGLGVRHGNEGIDCKINFLLLLWPMLECGGDTLLLFGEQDFTPLIGEPLFSSRISGISFSPTVCSCLFMPPLKWFNFPNLGTEDDPMVKNDRGGLPFEELGNGIDCLALWKWIYVIRITSFKYLHDLFNYKWANLGYVLYQTSQTCQNLSYSPIVVLYT